MNIFFKEIQKSFDLLDQEGTKQSSFMTALKYMLKIANESKCETEECTMTTDKYGDIVIAFKTKHNLLTITANNNGISYMGTGSEEKDRIHVINTESYSVSSEIFEWIQRNRRKV